MVLQANLRKICGISAGFRQINENVDDAGLDAGLDKMNGYSIKKSETTS